MKAALHFCKFFVLITVFTLNAAELQIQPVPFKQHGELLIPVLEDTEERGLTPLEFLAPPTLTDSVAYREWQERVMNHRKSQEKLLNYYVEQHIKLGKSHALKTLQEQLKVFDTHVAHLKSVSTNSDSSPQKKYRAEVELEFVRQFDGIFNELRNPAKLTYHSDEQATQGLINFLYLGVAQFRKGVDPLSCFGELPITWPTAQELEDRKKAIIHIIESAVTETDSHGAALCLYQLERLILNYPDPTTRSKAYSMYSNFWQRFEPKKPAKEEPVYNEKKEFPLFDNVDQLANEALLAKVAPDDEPLTYVFKRKCFLALHLNYGSLLMRIDKHEDLEKLPRYAFELYQLIKPKLYADSKSKEDAPKTTNQEGDGEKCLLS